MATDSDLPSLDLSTHQNRKDFLEVLSLFPALMIMVFIRRKLGFRRLHAPWIVAIAWVLVFLPVMFPDAARPFPLLLPLFGIAVAVVGLTSRYRRWCDICEGVRWHTGSPGLSYLERWLPIPPILQRCRRTYRFLDPILCLLISLVAWPLSHLLGGLLFLSAVAVFVYEHAYFERLLKNDLDTLDGLVNAEVQAEIVKFYEGKQPDQIRRTLEETAGIPTGVAPDIERQVELRRARRKAAPDNIVLDTPQGVT